MIDPDERYDWQMDLAALQEKITRIDGVEAARVVSGNGHIEEIHVLARRNKPPKQLVRDVQSLSQALFGEEIDRRVVSVVQLADADLEGGFRPALVDVGEVLDGSRAEVTVTLRWQNDLFTGGAKGPRRPRPDLARSPRQPWTRCGRRSTAMRPWGSLRWTSRCSAIARWPWPRW